MTNYQRYSLPILLLLCLVGYALAHWTSYFYAWTDENVHLYVANQVAEGKALYLDVASVRPPLIIYVPALLIKMSFTPLFAGRLLVFLTTVGAMFLFFFFEKKAALFIPLFFLHPAHFFRLQYIGITLVMFFVCLVYFFLLKKRNFYAGLSSALLLFSGQHGAIYFLGAFIYLLFKRQWRELYLFILGVVTLSLPIGLYFLLRSEGEFFNLMIQRHLYHFTKDNHQAVKEAQLWWWTKNWFLEQIFYLCPLVFAGKNFWGKEENQLLFLVTFIHVVVVLLMRDGLVLYYHPCVPFIVLLAFRSFKEIKRKKAILILSIFIQLMSWVLVSKNFSARDHEDYSFLPYQRFQQMNRLTEVKVAEKIYQDLSINQGHGSVLFGQPTIANLLAIMLQGSVPGKVADFDPFWLESGEYSMNTLIQQLENEKIQFFVTPAWYYIKNPTFSSYLGQCYYNPKIYEREEKNGIPRIYLFYHRPFWPCERNL